MQLYDINLASRLLLGTAQYPSPQVLTDAISASGCGVITGLLRREIAGARGANGFWPLLQATGARILPNTAGCHLAREAITTAQMAREVFGTNWIKLEVIGNADTLQPDLFALVEAARVLCADGFAVFPYTTEDLIVAERLLGAGCRVLMPWRAPIGSGRGLRHVDALASMRGHFPGVPLIIDAGIGAPSQAAQAMEMGFDAVLLNTAVAKAGDPVAMARAFGQAVAAGRQAFEAGLMPQRDMAVPSTPVLGMANLGWAGWGWAVWYDPAPLLPGAARCRDDRPAGAFRRASGAVALQGRCGRHSRSDRGLHGCVPATACSLWSTTTGRRRWTRARISSIWGKRTWTGPTPPPSSALGCGWEFPPMTGQNSPAPLPCRPPILRWARSGRRC